MAMTLEWIKAKFIKVLVYWQVVLVAHLEPAKAEFVHFEQQVIKVICILIVSNYYTFIFS